MSKFSSAWTVLSQGAMTSFSPVFKRFTNSTWILLFLAGGGCAHSIANIPEVSDSRFRIGCEDILEVTIWRDADISRVVPVRPDGFISLPLAGEIQASGKLPAELANDIQQTLSKVMLEPRVTVVVREVNSSRFYITGEVVRPGTFLLRGKVSLLQAVALAGGFTAFADRESIVLIREPGNSYLFRYSDLIHGQTRDVYLNSGDTLVVP